MKWKFVMCVSAILFAVQGYCNCFSDCFRPDLLAMEESMEIPPMPEEEPSKEDYFTAYGHLILNSEDPFTAAFIADDFGKCEELLAEMDDVNATCEGYSPLHLVSQFGVKRLVNLYFNTEDGRRAIMEGEEVILPTEVTTLFEKLLARGADVNAFSKFDDGETPLFLACLIGNEYFVRRLIEEGADVSQPTKEGYTPIEAALHYLRTDITKILLENGATVPSAEAIAYAYNASVWLGKVELARILLENGANVNEDFDGECPKIPMQIAIDSGNEEMIALLREFGAVN